MKNMITPTAPPNGNNGHHAHDALADETLVVEDETIVLEDGAAAPKPGGDKRKRKPLWPLLVILVVFVAGVVVVGFVLFGGFFRTTEVAATVQTQQPSAATAITQRQEADKIADKLVDSASIAEARKETPAATQTPADGAPVPGVDKSVTLQAGDASALPPGAAGTVASRPQAASSGANAASGTSASPAAANAAPESSQPAAQQAQGSRLAALPASAASAQQSFRYKPAPAASRSGRGDGSRDGGGDGFDSSYSFNGRPAARGADGGSRPGAATTAAPVVPPFGTVLPVRTLGALYTLRSSGTVRLELARDVEGRGWSLRRGTVLVATLKGSDVDRAYVAVTGYIHPATGALVRFGGDVLGQDGAGGLKGKRRLVGSRWSSMAAEIARSGRDLLQSALAGRSGGTTIVNGQDPLSTELDGLRQRNQRREFVEVEAGTFGYVMVSDLPPELDGQLPAPVAPDAQGVQLSDAEIATLLTSGTPEQIRAALPRMAPGMRAVADSLLKHIGDQ